MNIINIINKHKNAILPKVKMNYDIHIEVFLNEHRVYYQPDFFINLTTILFSTPFISLLEWKKWWSLWAERDNINWLSIKTLFWGSSDYHKINLVLLNTDEGRISYLENNTI